MNLHSTNNLQNKASFGQALIDAYPSDKGLYVPDQIIPFAPAFFETLRELSFSEIAYKVATHLLEGEIPGAELGEICKEAFNFQVPLIPLDDHTAVLELFQGPTLAFKDFGARFMALCLRYFAKNSGKHIVVLTATSGDTGGAVASGFLGVENVDVVILYPEGKVSDMQRKQLTTPKENIHTLSVQGNFDDCQRLVKEAFLDSSLQTALQLCSANSINIGRLIPQSFYYFYAYSRRQKKDQNLVFSIPSGNYGNLTAGILAKRMGLPVKHFIAANNENDVVSAYLNSGNFLPRPSIETLSSAMDVGNPSNFARILEFYQSDLEAIRRDILGYKISDTDTEETIREVFADYHSYVMDPHTAVGFKALELYRSAFGSTDQAIVLGTAHPAKFPGIVEKQTGRTLEIPVQLTALLGKTERFEKIEANLDALAAYLKKNF